MKIEQTKSSETSAYKIQTPGNYPEESKQRSERGESLKSRTVHVCLVASISRVRSSGVLRRVLGLIGTNASEARLVSIFRIEDGLISQWAYRREHLTSHK